MTYPTLNDVGLTWSTVTAIAEYHGWRNQSVFNLVTGRKEWRKCENVALIRALYQAGWRPVGGRRYVHLWLAKSALKAQREAEATYALLTAMPR